jgi:hypothetical protein
MSHRLEVFADVGLDEALLKLALDEHQSGALLQLRKLWTYYRNAPEPVGMAGRGARRLAQEAGLPARLSAQRDSATDDRAWRREIVIENDIAWRIHAMVDFMFGKPVRLESTARSAATRQLIEQTLDAVWEASGGIALLQDMALLGHIYGHVDLLLRPDEGAAEQLALNPVQQGAATGEIAAAAARVLRIEVIEPTRGIALLNPGDYRRIDAYIVHFTRQLNRAEAPVQGLLRSAAAWWRSASGARGGLVGGTSRSGSFTAHRHATSAFTEIFSASWRQLYEDGNLIEESENLWTPGELPIVHIQNISQPFRYQGLSEVEPLIPLQDELNTRLSDRASRVTMQSFRMYLARGVDAEGPLHLAPGQILRTDNTEASIQAFGGDAETPGEAAHIQEIREAMDKTSGIPPLASGVVRAKIGNLTSANALRITLMGVLSKTARKRVTYGRGMSQMCRLILTALDSAGILPTDPADRGVRLVWPDPLPEDVREKVAAARAKRDLGVPAQHILAELGHTPEDPGIT